MQSTIAKVIVYSVLSILLTQLTWPLVLAGESGQQPQSVLVESIVAQSESDSASDRYQAVQRLGELGPAYKLSTEGPLLKRLEDPEAHVRIAACLALLYADGQTDAPIKTLLQIVQQPLDETQQRPRDPRAFSQQEILQRALDALAQFGGDAVDAVPALQLQLDAKNIYSRQSAAIALRQIGPGAEPAIDALGKLMHDTRSEAIPLVHWLINPGSEAARALRAIGLPALPVLLDALNSNEEMVRFHAVRELGFMPEAAPQIVGLLIEKLSDPSNGVQLQTLKSLGQLSKAAQPAVPAIVKFVFRRETMVSFPSGSGIGQNEQFSGVALRTLDQIGTSEEVLVQALRDALEKKESPTFEAVCLFRKLPHRKSDFVSALGSMLAEKNLGAAAALAALGIDDAAVQTVLKENLKSDGEYNPLALLGICLWIAHGQSLEDELRSQLIKASESDGAPLLSWVARLRLMPDDQATVDKALPVLLAPGNFFEAEAEREQANLALCDLINHPTISTAMVRELDQRERFVQSHFLAARVLLTGGVEVDRVFAALAREAHARLDSPAFGIMAEFLQRYPTSTQSKLFLLEVVQSNSYYVVHGDAYGNGGEGRIVGDQAAQALIEHKDFQLLTDQLDNTDARVRERVVRALGRLGTTAITPRLLKRIEDPDSRVRLQLVRSISSIGLEYPDKRAELRSTLNTALQDHRRSIRDEANRALKRWGDK